MKRAELVDDADLTASAERVDGWTRYDLRSPAALVSVEGELRDFLHEVDVASILQDARYLVANAGIQDAYGVVYVLRRDGRVIGLAGFVHEPSFLRIGVGPIGLPRLSIWRYVARAEPLFAPDVSEDEQYRYSAAMVAGVDLRRYS